MRFVRAEIIERHHIISVIIEFENRFVVERNVWIKHKRELNPVENQIWIIDQNAKPDFRLGFRAE